MFNDRNKSEEINKRMDKIYQENAEASNSAVMPGSDAVVDAAYAFVDSMVPKADVVHNHTAPLWYGWALREAFIAGSKFKG